MKEKFKPIIIIIVAIILLLGGASFFIVLSKSNEKTKELSTDEIVENMVSTETITTDLLSGGFVQIGFQIQTSATEAKEELTKRDFQVRNIATRLLSGMNEDQVKNIAGMDKFETEMKNEINELMQNGSIVQIYTTNKMIQ